MTDKLVQLVAIAIHDADCAAGSLCQDDAPTYEPYLRQAQAAIDAMAAYVQPPRLWTAPDIIALRTAYGLPRARFADLLAVSRGTVRLWESGTYGRPQRHSSTALDWALATAPPDVRRKYGVIRAHRAVGSGEDLHPL